MRRNGRRRHRRDWRRCTAVARALERGRIAGGDSPGVGRCRSRARIAPARARHLRRRRRGARRRKRDAGRHRCRGGHTRPGSGGVAARWRRVRQGARVVAWHSGRPGSSSRRAHRIVDACARRDAAPCRGPGGFGRAHEPVPDSGARPLPGDWADTRRRGRRGIRQGREAPRARLSGRARDRSRGADRQRSCLRFSCDAVDARRIEMPRSRPATAYCRPTSRAGSISASAG